jgi:hypothetical protein
MQLSGSFLARTPLVASSGASFVFALSTPAAAIGKRETMQVPQDLAAQLVEPDRVFVLAKPAGGEYFRLLVRQAATAQRYSRPWQRLELKFSAAVK